MSPGEADCSCHIASAYWLDKEHVVVWLDRLKTDKDGSKWYYAVRLEDGRYVVDASGSLRCNGRVVSLSEYEALLAKPRKRGEWIQVSLSPNVPSKLYDRLRALHAKYRDARFRI